MSIDLTAFQSLHEAVVYIKARTRNVNRIQVQKEKGCLDILTIVSVII